MYDPSKNQIGRKAPSIPRSLLKSRDDVQSIIRSAITPQQDYLKNSELNLMLRYHLGLVDEYDRPSNTFGGKAFRTGLCVLACEAAGGKPAAANSAAAAIELVHNFSLIHDDIQDQDEERRHRPTVWKIWGAAKAINAGNALRMIADQELMKLTEKGFSKEISLKASRLLANRSLQMIQGQYLDISFEERLNVSSREYKKMIAHKTGALISCAMELGAITASSKRNLSSLLGKVGWYFGYMFQLKDDVLGVWGDESITGKAQGSDIQRKKKTYPILYALRNAPVKQKTTLHKIFRKQSLSDEDVSYTMCVLEDMKIREKTAALVQEMSTEAMRLIAGAPIPPKTMNEFSDIVNYLLEREK